MRRTALPSILVLLILALGACSAGGASPDPSGSGDGGDGGDGGGGGGGAIPHPAADELVFSISFEGGFATPEMIATQFPWFTLLGDGRVITQGAQTLEFPGPALPALQVRTLTEEGIQDVLEAVAETELFTGDLVLRGAMNFVADAPDTVFTLHADERETRVVVYGLGALAPDMPMEGISAAELDAHRVLGQLSEQLRLIDEWLLAERFSDTGWQPYAPEALRLYLRDATGEPQDDPAGQVREWPVDADPAAFGEEVPAFGNGTRCGVVEGADGETWLAELQAAAQNTRWTDDGERRFAITPRPLLPFEERTCPELAAAG